MKIGIENKQNNNEKIILNTEEKNENQISQNKQVKYDFFSHLLGLKINVNYENEIVTFEDGVTYSFDEIREMNQQISTADIYIGHLLKDVFKVTYAGKVKVEAEDE